MHTKDLRGWSLVIYLRQSDVWGAQVKGETERRGIREKARGEDGRAEAA